MKYFLFLSIHFFSLSISAQLITQKNGKYGITNLSTGDLLVEQKFDEIYQLRMRPRAIENGQDMQNLPIFACVSNNQIQLFNSTSASFYDGIFDEIKLYKQTNEQSYGANPPIYIPHFVDCFMLRKGKKWGFISFKKEYGFHDRLEETDTFKMIEPQYQELKFVKEAYGYNSKIYSRRRRIVAAKKDSLWGAVSFETGEIIVPFKYKLPIHTFENSFDRRGIEFLSMEGGFIPYYIARETYVSMPQIIINPQHPEIWFELDFQPQINIYKEYEDQYLYVEPMEGEEGFFKLFEYNTGKELLAYKRDLAYKHFSIARKHEYILNIVEYTNYEKRFRATWFNLATGQEILFAEGKSYKDIDFNLNPENDLIVMKGRKPVGKIMGEGSALKIEWSTKKVYTKKAIKN